MKIKTTIRLNVEVEGSFYGKEWTMDDILKQAEREALSKLRHHARTGSLTILGEPQVIIHAFTDE